MASKDERVLVISGPSGSGKSTIINGKLLQEFPDKFGFSVSPNRTAGPDDADTTRKPRGQEKDGVEYHFTTRELFEKMISEGGFIEHAKFGDNYYGTSYQAIKDIEDAGRRPLLDIEME
ncbi:hypothetical protein LTS18_012218, partial [Coniosporium uncinatum]